MKGKIPIVEDEIAGEIEAMDALSSDQRDTFLKTFPIIKRIVSSRLSNSYRDAVEDITQKVLLKLWRWRTQKADRDLSTEEWQKLANTAAQNEVKTFYTQKFHKETFLYKTDDAGNEYSYYDESAASGVEGNSNIEIRSLLLVIWEEMKKLSIRQRLAILLQKQDFIVDLILNRCCTMEEMAASLDIGPDYLAELIRLLPLSDVEICGVFEKAFGEKVNEKQIWEARGKGKAKLTKELIRIGIR